MRRALTAAAAAFALLPAGAAARGCPAIPPPPAAGHAASPERVDAYLRAVAAASPLVTTGVAGASTDGRPLRYAVATRLASVRLHAGLARLRAVRAGILSGAPTAPAVVWLAAAVHGNEPSGADADLRVLHDLAADCHAPTLRNTVVVFLPVQNPDGRAAGTRVSGAGFDLNRDWLAATQPETLARYRLLARYPPLVFADQHEQGGRTFFAPPYSGPLNAELAPSALAAERGVLGPAIARALSRRGIARETGTFDLLYPGYGDSATTLLYGAAGMTLEAGDQVPFARRVAAHEAAAAALVRAVAAHRATLVRRWPRAFAASSTGATRGWALGPGSESTVAALLAQGVRVGQLDGPAHVGLLRPWSGAAGGPADLPRGTWIVSARQPLSRWLRTALARRADDGAAAPSDDVRAWSLGQFAAGGGGTIASALPDAPVATGAGAAARPLAGRRIALLADPGAHSTARAGLEQPNPGTAWARWALTQELGAGVDVLDGAALAGGALPGHDTLVVADGTAAQLDGAALDAVRGWVLAGGTLAGWRGRAVAVARAAGLTDTTLAAPAFEPSDAGTAVEVAGAGAPAAVLVADDPVLTAGTVVARYAPGDAAATDDRVGAGRVVLLGFDPAFRAGTPGATALLSRLLLASGGAR